MLTGNVLLAGKNTCNPDSLRGTATGGRFAPPSFEIIGTSTGVSCDGSLCAMSSVANSGSRPALLVNVTSIVPDAPGASDAPLPRLPPESTYDAPL